MLSAARGYALGEKELEHFLAGVEQRAYHIAHGALWDREGALDVVQESMTRLVQYYRQKPAADWPRLFHTILNSRINEARRKRLLERSKLRLVSLTGLGRRRDSAEQQDQIEAELPAVDREDGISAPEAAVMGEALGNRISAAMQSLSWRQRQVFMLRERQGYSVRDTAQLLGCSENAVKQHHFRALRTLRNLLSEVWEHE